MLKSKVVSRFLSRGFVVMSLVVLSVSSGSIAQAADLKILVVNPAAIFQNSLAGRDMAIKMQAIMEAITTDERAEMEPLAKEAQELQGQRALLGDGFAKKQVELQRKVEFIKYKYDQERKFSQDNAQRIINNNLSPLFSEIMQEQKGSLLLDQSQIVMASQDFNITADVIKRLDARMPTVEVKRITFAEIQKAYEEQQAKLKAAQVAKK